MGIPFDKSYANLTPQQLRALRSDYNALAEDDEPPFPLGGLQAIYRPIARGNDRLGLEGDVLADVMIGIDGVASEIRLLQTPNDPVSQMVAAAVLSVRYKPARCAGVPCAMGFRIRAHLEPSERTAERRLACLRTTDDAKDRIEACSKILDSGQLSQGTTVRILTVRARLLAGLGSRAPAMADLDAALRLRPADAVVFGNRADVQDRFAEWSAAIADYTEAIRLAPREMYYRAHRALDRGRIGDAAGRLADADALAALAPRSAGEYKQRGMLWSELGESARGLADLERAVALDPDDDESRIGLSRAWIAQGQLERALGEAGRAVALAPKSQYAAFERGTVLYLLGRYEESAAEFATTSRLAETRRYAVIWRALALRRAGHAADASASLEADAVRFGPGVWPGPVISFLNGKIDSAALYLAASAGEQQKRRDEQTCEADFYLGEVAAAEGHEKDARALFAKAAASCPDNFHESRIAKAELARTAP